jgi:hypothetical protein
MGILLRRSTWVELEFGAYEASFCKWALSQPGTDDHDCTIIAIDTKRLFQHLIFCPLLVSDVTDSMKPLLLLPL